MQSNSVSSSHHNFRSIFVHGTFTVSNVWDIFDHHLDKKNQPQNTQLQQFQISLLFSSEPFAETEYHTWISVCVCVTHTVIRLFSRLKQYGVWLHHVVHHVALGYFFGAELLRGRQVLPVIVAKVIVADDRSWLWSRWRKAFRFLCQGFT